MKIILVIPAYNEEKILESSIKKLYSYMKKNIQEDWQIVIANNASTDNTKQIADNLSKKLTNIKTVHLKQKGRGNALKQAWTKHNADVYAYCDVDLATNLSCLNLLFKAIREGNNIAIGNRYIDGADSKRTIKRYILSKIYILLLKSLFKTKITDFQCGFKAIDNKTRNQLLPKIQDNEWFFDTELILTAERENYKISQIPIKWREARVKDSKVKLIKTSLDYIRKSWGLKKRLKWRKKKY